MRFGPQNRTIWAFDGSSILTELRKLCGHDSIGPSGVRDQSISRINLPISPPPVSQSARAGAIAFSPPKSMDNLPTADLIHTMFTRSQPSVYVPRRITRYNIFSSLRTTLCEMNDSSDYFVLI